MEQVYGSCNVSDNNCGTSNRPHYYCYPKPYPWGYPRVQSEKEAYVKWKNKNNCFS